MNVSRIARQVSTLNVNFLKSCRSYHNSKLWNERVVEMVPALGESITEGTIANWFKSEGEQINVDDAVAMVETDKVTVEIKSTFAGVMVKRSVEADETVIVGQPLYEVETDGSIAPPAAAQEQAQSVGTVDTSVKVQEANIPHPKARIPMIKFLGKRSLLPKSEPVVETKIVPSVATSVAAFSEVPTSPQTGVDFYTLKGRGFYGRPTLSDKEIEAIESGGASEF